MSATAPRVGTVASLHIYPIKSCRGIDLKAMEVGAAGPRHDREWMLVDTKGNFLSQRKHARLATVQTALSQAGVLQVNADGMGDFVIDKTKAQPSVSLQATIWKDTVDVENHSRLCDEWFSQFLKVDCHLVRLRQAAKRHRVKDFYPQGFDVQFADSMPFLLANQASLADLNARMTEPVPISRFRPNIVIQGAPAFAEDSWSSLQIGDIEFPATMACERCVITTIDQVTGKRGVEPLQTMAKFRKIDGEILFGICLIHQAGGVLRVGDAVSSITAMR